MARPCRGLRPLSVLLSGLLVLQGTAGFARAAPRAQAVPVTVLYLPYRGVTPPDIARLSRAFHAELRLNDRLVLHDSDKLLAEFAGDVPRGEVARANGAAEKGQKLLARGDAAEAVEVLTEAVEALEGVLPFIKKTLLADAMLGLGAAYAKLEQVRRARKTFERLLTWRPIVRYDSARFDLAYSPIFERAKAAVKRRERGSVELRTHPAGAKAYIDGRYVGVTPTVAFGIKAGRHYATFKKAGYVKAGQPIEVSSREQLSHREKMRRSEKFLLLKQALTTARHDLGRTKASPAIADLGRVLFVDQLILTAVRRASSSHLDVQAYLYDMRSKALLKKVRMSVDRSTPRTMPQVARLLYFDVRYDGSLQAPPEPPPPPARKSAPLYTRWWLWVAIAAGLAAGATAVALPLALREEPCPDGFRCAVLRN